MKKKKTKIVILVVVLVFVVGIGILLWTQTNNLRALRYAMYTPKERQRLLQQNQERVDAIMDSLPVNSLTLLEEEQEAKLRRGEMSESEALQIMTGASGNSDAKEGTEQQTSSGGKKTPKDENSKLQELLAKVYLLRSSYTGQLDSLVGQAKSEYVAQKKANGKADKTAIATSYINKGLALEKACDGQMETLLSEIKAELERIGGDISVIGEIRETYNTEKSLKKADLLSRYAS